MNVLSYYSSPEMLALTQSINAILFTIMYANLIFNNIGCPIYCMLVAKMMYNVT